MSRWTMADVRAVKARHADDAAPPSKPEKYRNQRITVDGIAFDSKKESERYLFLKMRERLGEIEHLDLQPVFEIFIQHPERGRIRIGDYTADFRYWEKYCGSAVLRIEDTKSPATKTEAYQLRKRLVEAIYGITIVEV